MSDAQALEKLNEWGGQPLPISASAYYDGALGVRLSGAGAAVRAARERLGGELIEAEQAQAFWLGLREQTDPFFVGEEPLWRLSVPSIAGPLDLPGPATRRVGRRPALAQVGLPRRSRFARRRCGRAGMRHSSERQDRSAAVFQPLPATLQAIHRRLKQALDPQGIFNPGRMYRTGF